MRQKTDGYSRAGVILRLCVILFFSMTLSPGAVRAQEDYIDFESDRWDLKGAEVMEYMGRKSLSGSADLKDVEFENGVIEFDLAIDGTPSYPGIIFRQQSEGNCERFYIRPHRANGYYTEALQYTPVFNRVAGWQLYSGEGFTQGAIIPFNQWVHFRIEVLGKQTRVYVGNDEQPALLIHDLKHGVSKGSIGILSQQNTSAWFSNFRYETTSNLEFDPPPEKVAPLGMLHDWELSQVFPVSQIDIERLPDEQGLKDIEWQKVQTDRSGLLDIARYKERSSPAADCLLARTIINSPRKGEAMNLRFGYSDAVSIFLNGELIFFGNSAYRQRSPAFQGIIGLNDAVYLPLKKGENELLMWVAESFGGWGLMCQDGNTVFEHNSLTKSWELARELSFPESVVYDPSRDILYVSNYFNNGREFISKVKLNGEIEELEWITGLNRPTGLCMYVDKLYAVDRTNLVKIDPELGQIVDRYPIPGAVFTNDVAFDRFGNAYISDSNGNAIYRFSEGEVKAWLHGGEINNPNGLHVDDNTLIVGNSGDASLKVIDLSDRNVKTITSLEPGSNIDGIKSDGKGNYIISDYNGRVFRVTPSGQKTELLNTTVPGFFCADLEYITEKGLLIIPTLYDNRIMAYELE